MKNQSRLNYFIHQWALSVLAYGNTVSNRWNWIITRELNEVLSSNDN